MKQQIRNGVKQGRQQRRPQKHPGNTPPAVKRERRLQREREHFTEPLTGRQARRVARSEAGAEYDPVIRGIASEARANNKAAARDASMYQQLTQNILGSAAANDQATDQYRQSIDRQIAEAQSANDKTISQISQASQQQAAMMGAPAASATAVPTEAAGGALAGRQQAIALNAPTLAAGASQSTAIRRAANAAAYGGIEAIKGDEARGRQIREDLRAARKQKGQATVGKVNALRENAIAGRNSERAFSLEERELATKEALDQAKLAQSERQSRRTARTSAANSKRTAASSAASTKVSASQAAIAANNARREQEEFEYEQKHGTGSINSKSGTSTGKGGRTPSQVREDNQDWRDAQATASNALQTLKEAKAFPGWNLFQQLLVTKYNIRGTIAKKIVQRMRGGKAGQDVNGPNSLGR